MIGFSLWNIFLSHFMLLNFKFVDGSFEDFMVAIIVVVVFMVSFFKVTYSSFQFLMVTSISFLGYKSHFLWLHFHVFFLMVASVLFHGDIIP